MVRIVTKWKDNVSVARVDTTYENAVNHLIKSAKGTLVAISKESCIIDAGDRQFTVGKITLSSYPSMSDFCTKTGVPCLG